IGDWNGERLLPMLELDVWQSIVDNRQMFAFPFMETSAFLMIFPLVQGGKYTKPFLKGITLAALNLSLVTFLTIGILGVVRASHLTYPIFTIARELDFGGFIQHVEATTTMFWIFAIFIKLTVSFYCATLGLCQLFHIQSRGVIAFSLIWLIAGIALSNHANVIEMIAWDQKYDFGYQLFFSLFIPLLLFSVRWMRGNRVDHGSDKSL
ncbi:MAG: germination protein, partial [Brevibacillus sp.]|nr:germination protein [Brevibacillus sp.]